MSTVGPVEMGQLRASLRKERPSDSRKELRFDSKERGRDGLLIDVCDEGGARWTGIFAFGEVAVDLMAFVPESDRLVVVSHGQGYVVSALEPHRWATVPSSYIQNLIVNDAARCVIASDDWCLYAIWDIDRISVFAPGADGISDLRIEGGLIRGIYEDASSGGTATPFTLRADPKSYTLS